MTEPLVAVQDLCITLQHSGKQLVNRVNFKIHRGETVALVGESGAGKSLTAHSLVCLTPDSMQIRGSVLFGGENLLGKPKPFIENLRGDRIGMIFQEPMSSLNPLHTVEHQVQENLLQHQILSRHQAYKKTQELFRDVELPNPAEIGKRLPHELSGGQRQRVMIAMAIANKPDLLIADEPTTALDVTVQEQILILLNKLQQSYGMTILFITHDLGLVQHHADRVCVMSNGHLVEEGNTEDIFQNPQHAITRSIIKSEPAGQPCPLSSQPEQILTTSELEAWYKQRQQLFSNNEIASVFHNLSISLYEGETLGLVGESGSGKTTIALALLRLLRSKGEIHFRNRPVHDLKEKQFRPLRQQIQMVFQDPFGSLNPRLSIREILEEGLILHTRMDKQQRFERMKRVLEEVGLSCLALDLYPHEFSGGQRQRIALARALVLEPALIILDEPTSSLDRSLQLQLIELLRKIQKQHGTSYIFISHDLSVVRAMSHRIVVMKAGQLIECNTAETILTNPQHQYTKELVEAAFHRTSSRKIF